MASRRLRQRARLAAGLRGFLSEPLDVDAATHRLQERLETREARFVDAIRTLVYENEASPYRALLRWAGCELGDLATAIHASGIERALAELGDAGVRLSLDEFKSREPIVRRGLTLDTTPSQFDNPTFLGQAVSGRTSGTTGEGGRIFLDWNGLAEETVNEVLLYETHGLSDAPLALWLPPPPGLAGIRNVLVHAKRGRAPDRWFSPTPSGSAGDRLATNVLVMGCRFAGVRAPKPRFVTFARAREVADWLAADRRPRVLSAFTSAAVRVADAVLKGGIDVGGSVVFATGEPLTSRRRRHLEEAGLRVFSRYVAAETGMVGGDCGRAPDDDGMHLYVDRVAAVRPADDPDGALLTTLSGTTPKVLVNVDIGDRFRLERRPCSCLFGRLGMDMHVSNVRSSKRLTSEGVTVFAAELQEIVDTIIERAGGGPDDAQLSETLDESGLTRVAIVVSPSVVIADEQLVEQVLDELGRRGPNHLQAAQLWRAGGTLSILRTGPTTSAGAKRSLVSPVGP